MENPKKNEQNQPEKNWGVVIDPVEFFKSPPDPDESAKLLLQTKKQKPQQQEAKSVFTPEFWNGEILPVVASNPKVSPVTPAQNASPMPNQSSYSAIADLDSNTLPKMMTCALKTNDSDDSDAKNNEATPLNNNSSVKLPSESTKNKSTNNTPVNPPYLNNPKPKINNNQIIGFKQFSSGSSKSRTSVPNITALSIKNIFLKKVRCFVYQGVVFAYQNGFYEPLSREQLQQMILSVCEREIAAKGSFGIVEGAVKFIVNDPKIQHKNRQDNEHFLTFQNGNLNVNDGYLYGHTPEIKTCYSLLCNYLPNMPLATPKFDMFLRHISGGDTYIEQRLWEFLGYCLAPDTKAKKVFLLQGVKHSGKSLLCRFLMSFFDESMVSGLEAHDLAEKFALSELANKKLCVSADMPAGPLNARSVSNIKKLSGNDLISASKKYSSNQQFYFEGKLILVSNHKLLTQNHDNAFEDRFVAIPFPYSIPQEEQDGDLLVKLLQEKDAVATKAIQYYYQLRQNHYRFAGDYEINSGDFLSENQEYSIELALHDFLEEFFECDPDGKVFLSDAHELFIHLLDSNIALNVFSKKFYEMASRRFNCHKGRARNCPGANPTSCIIGIKLNPEYE